MASRNDVCPDPSVHENSHEARLQDQASKAALYVTQSDKKTERSSRDIDALGPDGRLSAAGAAASLKYAQPQDLPSFPTVGIDTTTSGNKAATLANQNQKPFEHWKPELSSSASKAALLANRKGDFADSLWQPSASDNGLSAAGLAMRGAHTVDLDYGYTDEGHRKALLAATLSVNKKRDTPAPAPEAPRYPDAQNSAFNALSAATVAHKPLMSDPLEGRMSSEANEMSRITHLQNVPREMFGEHPPVQIPDTAEQRRQDALRAATLSNKQKVDETQRQLLEAQAAQAAMHSNVREQAKNYLTLQSEAQKLASERLAKLDPDGATTFRQHYGVGEASPPSSKYRLSLRGRRSNDEPADEEDDAKRAGRIRHQTRNLNEQFQSLEDKKKQDDRAALQIAAEARVKARMSQMDDKVFMDTGKVSPAMMEEWERQARIKANANVEERMKHYGKVHVGGGKFMDQSEIDAIAAGRMQPTLDEITDTAEKQRARDEEIRLDQERRKHEKLVEQAREKEKKDAVKRQKEEDKAARQAEKDSEKARKKEEKETAAAQKRLQKEEEKQLKEQRNQQDKAWIEEQQRTEKERVAKEDAAAAPIAETAEESPATAAVEGESSPAVIKDMRTGEPKDIAATQNQAALAPLAGSSKNYHGHDEVTRDSSDHAKAVAAAVVAAPVVGESQGKDTTTSEKVDNDPAEPEAEKINSVTSPATDAALAKDATQDPPGVPTTFPDGKQPADLVKSGRVPTDSTGAEPDSNAATSKSEKRRSGLKSMFTKFKRSSRHEDSNASASATKSSSEEKGKTTAPIAARSPSPSLSSDLPDSDDERPVVVDGTGAAKAAPVKKSADSDDFQEARDQFDDALAAPRKSTEGKSHSPVPGSKFQEEL